MWLLSFLPDSFLLYVVNGILVVGAVSSFLAFFVLHKILNKFPALAPYHLLFQVVSAALLVAGIYFKGGYGVEMEWRSKVAELEAKVADAEARANTKNVEVQEKIVTKTKVIKEKGKTQIEYVDRVITQDKEVVKYIEQCPVPKIIIDEHNAAAEMNKAAEGKK
jgi:hypothetical protein